MGFWLETLSHVWCFKSKTSKVVNIADKQFNSWISISQITVLEYVTDWLLNGNSWMRADLIIQVFLLLDYELDTQWERYSELIIVHPVTGKLWRNIQPVKFLIFVIVKFLVTIYFICFQYLSHLCHMHEGQTWWGLLKFLSTLLSMVLESWTWCLLADFIVQDVYWGSKVFALRVH